MKTVEREKLQKFVNRLAELNEAKDKAFDFLKEKNGEVNGSRWCNAESNYKELLQAGHDYTSQFEAYNQAVGQIELMHDLMRELAELNFWK